MPAGLQAQAIKLPDSSVHQLPEGSVIRLGRAPRNGLPVPWDMAISREHADVSFQDGRLQIRCLESARNPISYNGKPVREAILRFGESFRIGTTMFRVIHPPSDEEQDDAVEDDSRVQEHAYSHEELRGVRFDNSQQQLDLLSRLPELMSASQSDEQFASMLVRLLLDAIPQAEAVAVVQFDECSLDAGRDHDALHARLLRVDTRDGFAERFRPSQRLMSRALVTRQSVIHIWDGEMSDAQFTVSGNLGWAFCAPISSDACRGWCLYVSGEGTRTGSMLVTEDDLKSDLRFTELVAQFIGSVRHVRVLEEQKTQLSTFFSPKVIENLTARDSGDLLEPAERDITVLFCDVRGFSRKSEELRGDLHALLRSVREALSVMTAGVIERDGAVADFQGDAVLGFWGWPVAIDDGPLPACRAALAIHKSFQEAVADASPLLKGFSVGIGVAHGKALAGQIGTKRQAKVGVFGPVVNQGSRLEGLTKRFGVPICVSEPTADLIRQQISEEGYLRRLACVRPAGMESPLTAFALWPRDGAGPPTHHETIHGYETALEAFTEGHWREAMDLLSGLPASDGPTAFLTSFLAGHGPDAPHGWDGVISLDNK